MENKLKLYKAVIWEKDPNSIGQRISVNAESLEEARQKLKSDHGDDIVYTLYNEEDAEKSR